VTVIALKPGSSTQPDQALVQVDWSGITYRLRPEKSPRAISTKIAYCDWYLMHRATENSAANSTTPPDADPKRDTPATVALSAWVLEAITEYNDPEICALMDI
jgi:hypothetical protein